MGWQGLLRLNLKNDKSAENTDSEARALAPCVMSMACACGAPPKSRRHCGPPCRKVMQKRGGARNRSQAKAADRQSPVAHRRWRGDVAPPDLSRQRPGQTGHDPLLVGPGWTGLRQGDLTSPQDVRTENVAQLVDD